jgi:hypothetical protein
MKADLLLLLHLDRHPRQLRTRHLRFPLEHRRVLAQIRLRPRRIRHLAVLLHLLNRRLSPLARQLRVQAALLLDLNLRLLQVELTSLSLNPLSQRHLGVELVSARPLLPLPLSLLPFRWLNQHLLGGLCSQSELPPPHYQTDSGRSRSHLEEATLSGSAALNYKNKTKRIIMICTGTFLGRISAR